MLKRLLHEPLLHFTLAAVAIFVAYGLLAPSSERRADDIVVTAPKIEQLAAVFAKTWQRPPSPEELKGLIDAYVKEEIDVREALALGLDQGDTVIRRRLQQKIQFMTDAGADAADAHRRRPAGLSRRASRKVRNRRRKQPSSRSS